MGNRQGSRVKGVDGRCWQRVTNPAAVPQWLALLGEWFAAVVVVVLMIDYANK